MADRGVLMSGEHALHCPRIVALVEPLRLKLPRVHQVLVYLAHRRACMLSHTDDTAQFVCDLHQRSAMFLSARCPAVRFEFPWWRPEYGIAALVALSILARAPAAASAALTPNMMRYHSEASAAGAFGGFRQSAAH